MSRAVTSKLSQESAEGPIIPTGSIVRAGAGTVTTGPETAEALFLDRGECDRLAWLALRRFGIRRVDVEELLAETYLELSASDALVRSPKGFAYHVFYTRCCRWLEREGSRREEAFGLDPDAVRPNTSAGLGIDWSLALKQAFGRLSPVCRRLLVGYYVRGLSLKETAEMTGHSSKQVWKRLDACLRRLKQCLEA
jgi:RNA polymerase sigma factor (sigma-70 family)